VEFPDAVAQLQHARLRTRTRLRTAQAGDPRACADFAQRAAHRLDLAQAVVAFKAIEAFFPQPAVARFHPCNAERGPIHLEVQLEAFGQLVRIAIRLRKEIPVSIRTNRHFRPPPRREMQHRSGLRAEARRQHVLAGQRLHRPFEAFLCGLVVQPFVDFGTRAVVLGRRDQIGKFTR
jgi:hypothetical protein